MLAHRNKRIGLRLISSGFVLILLMGLSLISCDLSTPRSELSRERSGIQGELLDPDTRLPQIKILAPAASYDTRRWEAVLLMATVWQDLGFDVDLRGFPDLFTLLADVSSEPFNWDAYVSGYVGRPQRLDPDEFLFRPFHCSGIQDHGPNIVGYCNPDYDSIVEAQRATLDQEARRILVYKAQEILAHDVPMITLFHRREVLAYNQADFEGWTPVVGRGLWNLWSMIRVKPKTTNRTLKAGWATDMGTLNPLALGPAFEPLQWTYDTLVRIGPNGTPVPWAASDWKIIDDTTVEITLRKGMKFHDGEPVTVQDVKFSFDFIKKHGTAGFFPAALSPVDRVEIISENVLRFKLFKPFAPLFFTTFSLVYILPQHIWENIVVSEGIDSPAKWNNTNPVGSGPFKLAYHRRGEELLLESNKDHFDPPQVDALLIVSHSNIDGVFASLMNGTVDVPDRSISALNVPEVREAPHLGLTDTPDHGVFFLGFNLRRPPFNDLQVRRALAHTLDHKTVVEAVLGGFGEPGQGVIAPSNKFWHNPAWEKWFVEDYQFDRVAARRILQESGYRWDEEGKLHYPIDGPPVP